MLDTQRRLEVVRWHPSNDNLFAAVAASDRSVYLYDAQYTQVQAHPATDNSAFTAAQLFGGHAAVYLTIVYV